MKKIDQVILVDDHHPTNVIHKIVAEEAGCAKSIKAFTDPASALRYLQQLANKSYTGSTLIILDVKMPRIDGWTFANQLNAMLTNSRFNPKIIMTSNVRSSEHLSKMRSEPLIYDYLEKVLTAEQFEKLVQVLF
jgi:CheY-like chemotaxis protein